MSENKFHNKRGINWSLTIEEEIQEAINQLIEEKKSKSTKKVVWFSVLAILALLGAAIWIQAPKIYQAVREVGINSVEHLNDQVKQEIGGNY
jgi:cytochrome b subunit of formate dehydrogenase